MRGVGAACEGDAAVIHNRSAYLSGCRCSVCREANTAYIRQYRSTGRGRALTRNAQARRLAALTELRRRHVAEYREILASISEPVRST